MIATLKNSLDLGYKDMGDAHQLPTRTYEVAAGATQINPGEPVVIDSQSPTRVIRAADGAGVIATDVIVGISAGYSTQTADTAGTVEVFTYALNTVMRGRPKAAFANKAAADAVIGKRVVFDLTSGKYTIDAAATSADTNGVIIVAADAVSDMVDFKLDPALANYIA